MVRFQNLKCILLNNFNVCSPTSMKLIQHLVSEVRKMLWQNGGQGPITLGVMSLGRFSKCILLNIFYVCGPISMKLIPHLVTEVKKV